MPRESDAQEAKDDRSVVFPVDQRVVKPMAIHDAYGYMEVASGGENRDSRSNYPDMKRVVSKRSYCRPTTVLPHRSKHPRH